MRPDWCALACPAGRLDQIEGAFLTLIFGLCERHVLANALAMARISPSCRHDGSLVA